MTKLCALCAAQPSSQRTSTLLLCPAAELECPLHTRRTAVSCSRTWACLWAPMDQEASGDNTSVRAYVRAWLQHILSLVSGAGCCCCCYCQNVELVLESCKQAATRMSFCESELKQPQAPRTQCDTAERHAAQSQDW